MDVFLRVLFLCIYVSFYSYHFYDYPLTSRIAVGVSSLFIVPSQWYTVWVLYHLQINLNKIRVKAAAMAAASGSTTTSGTTTEMVAYAPVKMEKDQGQGPTQLLPQHPIEGQQHVNEMQVDLGSEVVTVRVHMPLLPSPSGSFRSGRVHPGSGTPDSMGPLVAAAGDWRTSST
jgi:hypothetical protein